MKIVCDLDGVIVDSAPQIKQFLLSGNQWDWNEYFKHTIEMPPIPLLVSFVASLINSSNEIYFLTGRPEGNRNLTIRWLENNHLLGFHKLIMRPVNNLEPSVEFKLRHCQEIHPDWVLEDEDRTVKELVMNGFKVLQIHGYRPSGHDHIPGTTQY